MTDLRVMIVADEPILALDLEEGLLGMGYAVTGTASSSDAALRLAAEDTPDVVLMDLQLHGPIDGFTTAALIGARHQVPFLFLTANADARTIQRAEQLGSLHGFLQKPVQTDDLRSTIEIIAHRHHTEHNAHVADQHAPVELESSPEATIIVDAHGRVSYLGEAAAALLSTHSSHVIGRPLSDVLKLVDPASGHAMAPAAIAVLHTGRAAPPREVALLDASGGAPRPLLEWAAPMQTDGRTTGAVTGCKLRSSAQRARLRMEQTDRLAALGTMAASVAHELNNPLSVVTANAEYLDEQLARMRRDAGTGVASRLIADLDHAHAGITDVRAAVAQMQRVVAELRDFARPAPSRSGRANVVSAIEWAVRATTNHVRHHARLITAFDPVPPVHGDEIRLGQVMVNLIVNAVDAIAPGAVDHNTIAISTKCGDGGRVVVEVADTGAGMPEHVCSRVFEPYFTTKSRRSGSGLGLAISFGIVRSLGGDVEIDSTPGVGTTVRLLLPLAPAPAADAPPPPAPQLQLQGRILVIDDEQLVLRAIKRTLRDHEVTCVTDATEALALIDAGEEFDVILSDVMMPELTGFDFYEALRARSPAFCELIVFMTGDATAANADDFFHRVPNPLISKPFDPRELQDLVQHQLAERLDSRTSDIPDAFIDPAHRDGP